MDITEFAMKYRLHTRRDEDATTVIPGKVGHLYEYDEGVFGVLVSPPDSRFRLWGHTKEHLLKAGFVIVQDGDHEGAATFDPTNRDQVREAMKAAGVGRRRRSSVRQLAALAKARSAIESIKTAAQTAV